MIRRDTIKSNCGSIRFLWHLNPIWGFVEADFGSLRMKICRSFRGIELLHFPGYPAIDTFSGPFLEILARRTRTLATVHDNFTTRSEATAREAQISSNFFLRWCSCLRSQHSFLSCSVLALKSSGWQRRAGDFLAQCLYANCFE